MALLSKKGFGARYVTVVNRGSKLGDMLLVLMMYINGHQISLWDSGINFSWEQSD